MTEQPRPLTQQRADAHATAAAALATYQDRHRHWQAKLHFMASNSSLMHGHDVARHSHELSQLAQDALAAFRDAETADQTLAAFAALGERQTRAAV